jgi:hypothetical protein
MMLEGILSAALFLIRNEIATYSHRIVDGTVSAAASASDERGA